MSQMRFYEFYAMGVPIFLPGAAVRGQDRNGLASSTTANDEILADNLTCYPNVSENET